MRTTTLTKKNISVVLIAALVMLMIFQTGITKAFAAAGDVYAKLYSDGYVSIEATSGGTNSAHGSLIREVYSGDLEDGNISQILGLFEVEEQGKITSINIGVPLKFEGDCSFAFNGLTNLTSIRGLNNIDVSKATSLEECFSENPNLTDIDISSWRGDSVTNINAMFAECTGLEKLDVSDFLDTINNVSMEYTFFKTKNLKSIDGIETWVVKPSSLKGIFGNSTITSNIDLNGFDVSGCSDFTQAFAGSFIRELNLSEWAKAGGINDTTMFAGAKTADIEVSNAFTNATLSLLNTNESAGEGLVPLFAGDWVKVPGMINMLDNIEYGIKPNQLEGGHRYKRLINLDALGYSYRWKVNVTYGDEWHDTVVKGNVYGSNVDDVPFLFEDEDGHIVAGNNCDANGVQNTSGRWGGLLEGQTYTLKSAILNSPTPLRVPDTEFTTGPRIPSGDKADWELVIKIVALQGKIAELQ